MSFCDSKMDTAAVEFEERRRYEQWRADRLSDDPGGFVADLTEEAYADAQVQAAEKAVGMAINAGVWGL